MPDHGFGKISERDLNFSNDGGPDPLTPHAAQRAVFAYDFAVDGGAVSTITLRGDAIPANAVVLNALYIPTVAPVSAAGSVALQIEAAGDLLATVAVTGNVDEVNQLIPTLATVTSYVQTTVARAVKLVVSAGALTAGKFYVVLDYVVVDAALATT